MNTTVETEIMTGGFGGDAPEAEPTETAIDLCKPGDLQMVMRSIANRWEPSGAIRQAISAQICKALDYYDQKRKLGEKRAASHCIKLARLCLAMDCDNMLAQFPELKGLIEMPRRRHPEKRKPRRRFIKAS